MEAPRRVRITGRAARFLRMLVDLGHLDDDGADRLVLAISDARGGPVEVLVDLPTVRRLSAVLLFERAGDGTAQGRLVDQEWPLLFS